MRNYPFRGKTPFPRHQWFIAAWSGEVTRAVLARVILNQPIIFFRTEAGSLTALSGLCPHRWAPLATGTISGDTIACPYHGAAFDSLGRCVSLPFQDHIPPALRLRTYPIIERGGIVWIWPGDADRVDPSLLPQTDSLGLGVPGWRHDTSRPILLKARAQLLLENLFDQSHVGFTHAATLGTRTAAADPFRPSEIVDLPGYFSIRHKPALLPSDAAMQAIFPDIGDHMTIQLRSELFGVGLVNGVGTQTFATDAQGSARRLVGSMNFLHGVTPSTDTTTHYFTAMTRDFVVDDDVLSDVLSRRNALVVGEDVAMLESIEPQLDAHADIRSEINYPTDAAAIRVRRRIEHLNEE